MNRPIKFRAWSLKEKAMREVAWIRYDNGQDVSSVGVYWDDGQHNGATRLDAEDVVVLQYTGLKDKNGVEIYEGNIVKILYTDWPSQLDSRPELSHEEYLDSLALTRVVIWSVQGFYVSHRVGGYAESMDTGPHGYIEVIGNIYENPELLKAQA